MTSHPSGEPLGGYKWPRDLHALTKNAAIGAAAAIAIWCSLLLLELLPGFTSDTSGLVLFAVIGLFVGATRFRLFTLVLFQLTAALIFGIALTPISSYFARHWVRRDRLPTGSFDAVIPLSGSLNPDTTLSGEALDHLITALELIHSRRSRILVTTTKAVLFPSGTVNSDADQSRILTLFPEGIEWLQTSTTVSTHDEAIKAAKLLLPQGLTHVAVITSPMHSRRACETFERAGFSVVCIPARLRGLGGFPVTPRPRERLAVFGELIYESLAIAEYTLRGWLHAEKPGVQ